MYAHAKLLYKHTTVLHGYCIAKHHILININNLHCMSCQSSCVDIIYTYMYIIVLQLN